MTQGSKAALPAQQGSSCRPRESLSWRCSMTDGRIPGQWIGSPEYDDFGVNAWGLFTRAIAWSNEHGTDGAIPTRYLGVIFPWEKGLREACDELVTRGKLTKTENGYQLPRWSEDARAGGLGQETASRVAELREQRRVRAQRARDRKRDPDLMARDVTRNIASDKTRDVTHRVGKDEERKG